MNPIRILSRPARLPAPAIALAIALAAITLGATAAGASAPKPGSRAPAFILPDLLHAKTSMNLESLAGRVVLVDFWASWCPPCRKTLPQLGRLRSRHPGLAVLAISVDEDRSKALDFLSRKPDTSVVFLHDAEKAAAESYDLGGMPSLYLIDKKGRLRFRHDGYSESDLKTIEAETRKLMEE